MSLTTDKPFRPPSNAGLVYVGAGEPFPDDKARPPEVGDFVLFHDADNVISKIIRFGQRFRIHGDDRRYAWWNHAALVVGPGGALVEALGAGVVYSHLSAHQKESYVVVRTAPAMLDQRQILQLARYAAGTRYGFLTILSIGLSMLTGMKFGFGTDASFICSGLVAEAQLRAGAVFNRPSRLCSPADLARYYDAPPPEAEAGWYERVEADAGGALEGTEVAVGEEAEIAGDGSGVALPPLKIGVQFTVDGEVVSRTDLTFECTAVEELPDSPD